MFPKDKHQIVLVITRKSARTNVNWEQTIVLTMQHVLILPNRLNVHAMTDTGMDSKTSYAWSSRAEVLTVF